MPGQTIVGGDDPRGLRIIEELQGAGTEVVVVASAMELAAAGLQDATAVICADDDDDLNLEIALLARQLNPTVRAGVEFVAYLVGPYRELLEMLSKGQYARPDVSPAATTG